jgi:restriction system protein
MPRRRRRRQHTPDDAVGLSALVLGALLYRQLSAISFPWMIALTVVGTSVVGTTIVWAVRSHRRRHTQQLLLADARTLTPPQFEAQVLHLLRDLGWARVQWVGGSGDGGVDLRGIYQGQRWIVQCKRSAGRVAPQYLRDLEGARSHERADRALLVTTGYITRQGYAWVRGKSITLWDGAILAQHLAEQRQRMEHPDWQQQERRRTRWLLGSLVAVNAGILLWAAVSAPIFVPAHPATVRQQALERLLVQRIEQCLEQPKMSCAPNSRLNALGCAISRPHLSPT